MKTTVLSFIISGLVLVALLVWAMNAEISGNVSEIVMIACVVVMVGFAVYLGFVRVRSMARKEVPEDEMTKKVLVKTSSLSYYISLYMWLFLMYISDKVSWETHTLIGAGVLSMAIIFFLSWLGVKYTGIQNG